MTLVCSAGEGDIALDERLKYLRLILWVAEKRCPTCTVISYDYFGDSRFVVLS